MTIPIRVLSLCNGPAQTQQIKQVCRTDDELQFVGAARTAQESLACRPQPDVVLISGQAGNEMSLRLIEEMAIFLPLVAVIVVVGREQVVFIQRALLAGARGFLLQPFTDSELQDSIRRIYRLEEEKHTRLAQGTALDEISRQGQILAVFSPKGGVGRTTIASNLAVALQKAGRRVVLVDGSLQFGDVPVVLNIIDAHMTIVSLVRRLEEMDTELLMETLVVHSSGVRVLLAPPRLEEADVIYPEAVARILTALQQHFDYVVIDAWPFLDDVTLSSLGMADQIILVTTPELPALREVRLFLELVERLEIPPSRLLLILNRGKSAFGIGSTDIEENIRYRIAINIPSDGPLVTRSLNRGVPLVISDPQSRVARSITQLADLVMGSAEELVVGGAKSHVRLGGVTHRLRSLLVSQ